MADPRYVFRQSFCAANELQHIAANHLHIFWRCSSGLYLLEASLNLLKIVHVDGAQPQYPGTHSVSIATWIPAAYTYRTSSRTAGMEEILKKLQEQDEKINAIYAS